MVAWEYDWAGLSDLTFEAFNRYLEAPPAPEVWDTFLLPRIHERLGQLYEERGELEKAAEHHRTFVERWSEADPELQPRVQAAREALQRVQRRLAEEGGAG